MFENQINYVITNRVSRVVQQEKILRLPENETYEGSQNMNARINESEFRFMDIVWDAEPVNSTQLVRLCSEKLGWKKSTTYTVIRNLSEKGVISNENAVVHALVSRNEVQHQESQEFLTKQFRGSIPAFIATLLRDQRLSQEEAKEIQKMIDEATEE